VSAVATRLANCESDVEISANQAMEERVITTAAAPVGSVGPISGMVLQRMQLSLTT
jgi:hypothetical protein